MCSEEREWVTLEDYIEDLLKKGKRSKDAEFKLLFSVFGLEKIKEIAKKKLGLLRQVQGDQDVLVEKKNS